MFVICRTEWLFKQCSNFDTARRHWKSLYFGGLWHLFLSDFSEKLSTDQQEPYHSCPREQEKRNNPPIRVHIKTSSFSMCIDVITILLDI